MANPIRLPFYEYQVQPSGDYQGPSFGQVIASASRDRERREALSGVVGGILQQFYEQQTKTQQAYDLAQLAKAKATYYATVKKAVEELEFSELEPMEYPNRFQEVSEEAYKEGQDLLAQAKGKTLLGVNEARTELTATDFEAWRIEQDAAFGTAVLQAQRKKMAGDAMEATAAEFTLLLKDPEYLPVFLDNLEKRRQAETISAEYYIRARESGKTIALIAGYDKQAKDLAASQGLAAAEAWVANRDNFELDEAAHQQFQQDFNSWAGATRSQAERTKLAQVQQAQESYLQRFVAGDRTFTRAFIVSDPMTARDPNAQLASEQADEVRRRFISMLEARANAANGGAKDPNELTNEGLKKRVMDKIYDPLVSKGEVEQDLGRYRGADERGNPQISLDDSKTLWSLNEQQKKSPAYGNAVRALEAASGVNRPLTDQEGADAMTALNNFILTRELAARDPRSGLKPSTEEEITQFAQNYINEGVFSKLKAGIKVISPTPSDERLREIWQESREKDWFWKKGRGGRAHNIEAFILRAQSGQLTGLASRPDYVPIYEEAKRVTDEMFRGWSGLQQGQYSQHVWTNGLIVYRVEQSLPQGVGRVVKFFTLNYDEERDKLFWALIQPSDRKRFVLEDRSSRKQIGFQAAMTSSLKILEEAMYQPGSPAWKPPAEFAK